MVVEGAGFGRTSEHRFRVTARRVAVAACGNGAADPPVATDPAASPASATDGSGQTTTPVVERAIAWAEALASLPIRAEQQSVPLPLDRLLDGVAAWGTGTVVEVSEAREETVATAVVGCEEEEGVPTGEDCVIETLVTYVDLVFEVSEWVAGADRAASVPVRVVLPTAVATVAGDSDTLDAEVRAARERLVTATPFGEQIVLGVSGAVAADVVTALALISPAGEIVPLPDIGGPHAADHDHGPEVVDHAHPVGLGEVRILDELIERARR